MDDITLVIRRCKRSQESKLNLSSRTISTIPQDIYQLTNLEILDLSHNQITSIDGNINKLQKLKFLDLSYNQIMLLPDQLADLKDLETLNLTSNPLSTKFKDLLEISNQTQPKLRVCLQNCFGVSPKKFGDGGGINLNFYGQKNQEEIQSIQNQYNYEKDQFEAFDKEYEEKEQKQQKQIQTKVNQNEQLQNKNFSKTGVNFKAHQKEQVKSQPVWFDNFDQQKTFGHSQQIQSKAGNEMEVLLKNEQKKVIELKKEIDMLKQQLSKSTGGFKSNFDQGLEGLNISEFVRKELEIDFNELKLEETISQGGFSIVHKGKFRGTTVAIKKIFNPNITQELLQDFSNEINMMNLLRHPHIVMLMGIVTKPPNLCIISELMQFGSLFHLLHQSKKEVTEQMKLKISLQIAKTLQFIHMSKIVHRDIKSYNVLLDENNNIKLCDFGLAKNISELNTGTMQFSGTPCYMSPELFKKKAYDEKIDVFSLGTLFWEIFARQVPWDGIDPGDIMQKILKNEQLKPLQNKTINNLVKQCRDVEPKNRPSLDEIVKVLDNLS